MDDLDLLLPTAALADAAVRLGIPIGTAPVSLVPLLPGTPFAGPAAPVTHLGSVDVLLETIDDAPDGAVLVVDNGGRDDEACVGDLMLLEAQRAGMRGAVIWGRHRDTAQLREIGPSGSDQESIRGGGATHRARVDRDLLHQHRVEVWCHAPWMLAVVDSQIDLGAGRPRRSAASCDLPR